MGAISGLLSKLIKQRMLSGKQFKLRILSNKLLACTDEASNKASIFSEQRRALNQKWSLYQQTQLMSNNHQGNLQQGSLSIFQCQNYNIQNDPNYHQFQMALQEVDYQAKEEEKKAQREEDRIKHEMATLETQIKMLEKQIEAEDKLIDNCIKDSAPKYC